MQETTAEVYQTPESDLSENLNLGAMGNFNRFTAWGVFGLAFITLGIYPAYWLYSRSKIMNKFHDNKISSGLINFFVAMIFVSFPMSFMAEFYSDNLTLVGLNGVVSIVYMVAYLIVLYSLRNRLMEVTGLKVGPVLTFFGNAIYLQYKINEAIDSTNGNTEK